MVSETVKPFLKTLLRGYRRTASVRSQFDDWRAERPFWGALLLIVAGLVLSVIPFTALGSFAFTGSTGELIGLIGLFFSFFVFLAGVAAMTQPQLSTLAGMIGIVMSILSIVGGTLGGMFVGTFLGMIGGSLCIAWIEEPVEEDEIEASGAERGAAAAEEHREVGFEDDADGAESDEEPVPPAEDD